MSDIFCSSCTYYRQHYSYDQEKFFRVYCGHCTYRRPRAKRPDAKACIHYEKTVASEPTFVTKEYLSKALLEYMLSLDLFTEICDTQEDIGQFEKTM